ncbi:hypothetical protein B566_EDAN018230, partial [Ephemera danica]
MSEQFRDAYAVDLSNKSAHTDWPLGEGDGGKVPGTICTSRHRKSKQNPQDLGPALQSMSAVTAVAWHPFGFFLASVDRGKKAIIWGC